MSVYKEQDLNTLKSIMLLLERSYAANHSFAFCRWLLSAILSYQNEDIPQINLNDYSALQSTSIISLDSLDSSDVSSEHINKLACIKLNGGLGTSMGCSTAKSLIHVSKSKRFVDETIESHQTFNKVNQSSVPLLLMNSFYTHEQMTTENFPDFVNMFLQNRAPRLKESSLEQASFTKEIQEWAPPGHGDLYLSLYDSGLLQQLIDDGREILFVSNIDNLSATINPSILNYMLAQNCDFLMEVTAKSKADIKGGSLATRNGQVTLIERAQLRPDDIKAFEDIQKFQLFNTNNLWINLKALKKKIESRDLNLPLIINKKTVHGTDVLQFESAMGAAIQCFENSNCILVNRDRFFPVKTSSDLLLLRASLDSKLNKEKKSPSIKLDSNYTSVDDFDAAFTDIPDMTGLNSLSIEGPFNFSGTVTLKGDVVIRNLSDSVIEIRDEFIEGERDFTN